MTVYVDDMRAEYGRMVMCHMIADTDEELHAMADRIGVARKWFQKPGTPRRHYDIALSKRALAVAAGATEITWREAGCMVARRAATDSLGSPLDAVAWRCANMRTAPSMSDPGTGSGADENRSDPTISVKRKAISVDHQRLAASGVRRDGLVRQQMPPAGQTDDAEAGRKAVWVVE